MAFPSELTISLHFTGFHLLQLNVMLFALDLQVMSLLKMWKYSAGKDWVFPGSIMAAYEPYMVTLFNNILTVWNRKDGARVSGVAVENGVVSLSVALREVRQGL